MKAFSIFCLFFLVVGCAHIIVGTQFDKTKLDQIVRGKTTKEEVAKTFGDPAEKGAEAGLERWVYINRVTSAAPSPEWLGLSYRGETKERMLAIIFDHEIVKDIAFSETTRPFVSSLGLNH